MKEIHCYGGYTSPPTETGISYTNATNDHIYLTLDTLNFTSLTTAEQKWQNVDRPANLRILPSLGSLSIASIATETQFVVYGGFTEPINQILSTTAWKCSTSTNNSWSPFPSQGFYSTYSPIVDLGGSRVWIWGGLEYEKPD
ncbi:hypothetical protein BCR42DRAFT_219888 [Absidia repens]|uniref:Galactose oxidase n=1 Tax=Absidia repens TaxID=90262 RepID=A0A1X2ING8_9FUNG|nr:hypothetical protein BCR42DRAFT_219888 [Absidia repens]